MSNKITRRAMLKASAVAGAGILFLPRNILAQGQSPNDKLNVALVGVGNQGGFQVNGMETTRQNVVAICDVDDRMLNQRKAVEKFPRAKVFKDFRKMYDEMLSEIDAVCVSVPDHTHFPIAIQAIRNKKHVYLEKPMAHSVAECRILTEETAKYGVATQLGCQRHILNGMVNAVKVIKSGAIGDVTEVYSWIRDPRGMPTLPEKTVAPPAELDWQLWLGPSPDYDYSVFTDDKGNEQPCHAPYNWRFWWDFGTAETGNWGCHILDIPYWALDLKYPVKVSASGDPIDPQRTSKEIHCTFVYPKRGNLPEVTLHWEGAKEPSCYAKYGLAGKRFPNGLGGQMSINDVNNLFIGTKGMMVAGFNGYALLPEDKFIEFQHPEKKPISPGFHQEWVDACKGGKPATCNFAYSGPMAETLLLGNTAFRAGHKSFDWNAEKMEAVNCPEVQAMLKPELRKGWGY